MYIYIDVLNNVRKFGDTRISVWLKLINMSDYIAILNSFGSSERNSANAPKRVCTTVLESKLCRDGKVGVVVDKLVYDRRGLN